MSLKLTPDELRAFDFAAYEALTGLGLRVGCLVRFTDTPAGHALDGNGEIIGDVIDITNGLVRVNIPRISGVVCIPYEKLMCSGAVILGPA